MTARREAKSSWKVLPARKTEPWEGTCLPEGTISATEAAFDRGENPFGENRLWQEGEKVPGRFER